MSWLRKRAATLVAAAAALTISGCVAGTGNGPASSSLPPPARASRPTDLAQAHAVYLAVDRSSSMWQSYPRLYSARVADGAGRPLLPDGVVTDLLEASADGSVIVYDASFALRRGATTAGRAARTWWWSDSTRTHQVTAMPADVLGRAVAADGRSVVVASGGRTSGATPSVVRVDLATNRSTSVCEGCIPAQKPGYLAHVALALSDDGALLASSTWASDLSSGFSGVGSHRSPTAEQVLSLSDATVRWSTRTAFCTPVTVSGDGTLVRSCVQDESRPPTLHQLTGVLGPAPVDRPTGLPGYESGPLPGGWWYATQSADESGPLTIRETAALTGASSTVVGRWPGGQQIEALRLAEPTVVDWPGPTPS